METRPDLESLCCVKKECKYFGQRGKGNLRVRKIYGKDQIRYLRCSSCISEFSERKGTALFNSKIEESKAVSIIEHLDSRCGVNATARLVKVAKDTVSRLNYVCGKVFHSLHNLMVKDLHPQALQFDEKWSFTEKKQKNLTPSDDPTQVGDHWDVNCIDPHSKLLLTLVSGPRTSESIKEAVADAAARLAIDAAMPAIFTDGEQAYEEAILQVFGNHYPSPRTSNLGRPPLPIMRVPHELVYAQVVKHRQAGKVCDVEIRPIFGKGKLDNIVEALGCNKANTSAIERFNLTDRSRNARKARKSLNFSKKARFHDDQSFISVMLYNFHHNHRSLSLKMEDGHWKKRTPAIAAGLTETIFSVLDLLRLSPIGR
jgi:hypothetical protein